jgi:hypothetical protein
MSPLSARIPESIFGWVFYAIVFGLACITTVEAGHIRPEVMAYNRALLEIEDRAELLTTVIELSGESPETARELVERLSDVEASQQWAKQTIVSYLESRPWSEVDSSVLVAMTLRDLMVQGSAELVEDFDMRVTATLNRARANTLTEATRWNGNLKWLATTSLPAYQNIEDDLIEALFAKVPLETMDRQVRAPIVHELTSQIDALIVDFPGEYFRLQLLLLLHLDLTGDLIYVNRLWDEDPLGGARVDAQTELLLRRLLAIQLILSCSPDFSAARSWGLSRVEEVISLMEPSLGSVERQWGHTLLTRLAIPFARLHPRTSPVQELARRSLRPESPLYPYRVQLIPLLAYNFEYLPETEFDELRWETLMRARREARDVLGALDAAIEAYPRRGDADTTGSVSQAAPIPAD